MLRSTRGGHEKAYHVEEHVDLVHSQYDENAEMSSTVSSTVPTGVQRRRFVPLTAVVFLGDKPFECTPLEFRVVSKFIHE